MEIERVRTMKWCVKAIHRDGCIELHKTHKPFEVTDLVSKLMFCSEIDAVTIVLMERDEE